MTFLDSLEFIFRRALAAEAVATWIWMTVCMLIMVFGLGLVWGKMWNREWGLFNHIGQAFLTVFLALLVGYGVLNWRLASQTEEWIQRNRESTIQSITNSSSFNRQVLSEAWKQLQPMGGQQDLLPPPEGGDEIRINAAPDALVLSTTAADQVKTQLLASEPFRWGVGLSTREPSEVASEAVELVPRPSFPVIVSPANEWTKAAATLQSGHALDTFAKQTFPAMADLKKASLILVLVCVGLQMLLIPIAALNDIKANPRV